jgi:hypothetical protein
VEDTIRGLQREFDHAELQADTGRLRQLLTDDFLSIGPRGFLLDKDEWIGRHVHFEYQALDTSDVDVRLYDKAAIVRNVQRNRATYKGQAIDLSVRVSQVWVQQRDQWRLAGIQFSPLAQEE